MWQKRHKYLIVVESSQDNGCLTMVLLSLNVQEQQSINLKSYKMYFEISRHPMLAIASSKQLEIDMTYYVSVVIQTFYNACLLEKKIINS